MKKIITTVVLVWSLTLLVGNENVLAKTVYGSVGTGNVKYVATASVTPGKMQTKKMMTPYYHKKVKGDKRLEATIGLTKTKTVGFSVSGDVQLGVDSSALGAQILAKAGCATSVSTTIQKSYTMQIYRNDDTGYYWLEVFCPTSKLKVTTKKYSTRGKEPKVLKTRTVTLNFAPKLNKIAYRYNYAKKI